MKWQYVALPAIAAALCLGARKCRKSQKNTMPAPEPQNDLSRELESRIGEFMEQDHFSLMIQPVMDFRTNTVCGGEVLSRLNHPERGLIFPDEFIPAIDAAGLYSEFDRYIFRKCCAWLRSSRAEGENMEIVSCNFSRKTLSEPDIAAQLIQIADSYGLPHGCLGIELMEQEFETDVSQFYGNLKILKDAGFRIILDDFGDGITSMQDIIQKPLDIVKIDRSMLLAADNDQVKNAYRGMVELAVGMGMQVVCEGIETEEQHRFAKEAGCHYGQGYLFFRPMDTRQVFEMIARSSIRQEEA